MSSNMFLMKISPHSQLGNRSMTFSCSHGGKTVIEIYGWRFNSNASKVSVATRCGLGIAQMPGCTASCCTPSKKVFWGIKLQQFSQIICELAHGFCRVKILGPSIKSQISFSGKIMIKALSNNFAGVCCHVVGI